ncbi:hypothetical protein [Methylobacterium bullatum]|uniref:Uncharacterized protein n=1 Tax=Methylobacterium bullatum TaxID=570505 RepID=A0AAV4Z835_9HYPH|nr:hypothetical protein [Methylobacterium bullatum]MBD8901322.1 hypothetical protein [Methylobacterium bullatum]GJD40117.1 hypothetical protein OICFNHDK_2582 [Methylobacterium bullatum]
MNDNEHAVYAIAPELGGWTVYDTKTLEPALVKSVRQVGLGREAAHAMADALNGMERTAPGSSLARPDGPA